MIYAPSSTAKFLKTDMKKAEIKNGIDRLNEILPELSGGKIGLITNHTGVNKNGVSAIDLLYEKGLLCCLFAPEHGIRGNAQAGEHISSTRDEKTGVPIYSLFGGSTHINNEVLQTLSAVAFDIQDVGARFYTYTGTLTCAMEDCAEAGRKLIVFDRINPIGGVAPEGTVLDKYFASFVGRFETATRHNLTVGEYARFINETQNIGCNLTVVQIEGWKRSMLFADTDLNWVKPSPNIKTPETCFYYIGTCLAEGTNLSEGRGTEAPFELIGAPWLNAEFIAREMNAQGLAGVKFSTESFVPQFSKYSGERCNGIRFEMTDPRTFLPFETALKAFELIRRTHKEFKFLPPYKENAPYFVDLLLGSDEWRRDDFDIEIFLKKQNERLKLYEKEIKKYYLY